MIGLLLIVIAIEAVLLFWFATGTETVRLAIIGHWIGISFLIAVNGLMLFLTRPRR